jgi:hypothetical protein
VRSRSTRATSAAAAHDGATMNPSRREGLTAFAKLDHLVYSAGIR